MHVGHSQKKNHWSLRIGDFTLLCPSVWFALKHHLETEFFTQRGELNKSVCIWSGQLLRSCDIVRENRTHVIKKTLLGNTLSLTNIWCDTRFYQNKTVPNIQLCGFYFIENMPFWQKAGWKVCILSVISSAMPRWWRGGGWGRMRKVWRAWNERSWLEGTVQEIWVLKSCGLPANCAESTACSRLATPPKDPGAGWICSETRSLTLSSLKIARTCCRINNPTQSVFYSSVTYQIRGIVRNNSLGLCHFSLKSLNTGCWRIFYVTLVLHSCEVRI